jgi:hypothetical protein
MQHGKSPDPSLAEPDKMDFDIDAQGNVDIYFTEIRPGNIKRYSAVTKTVKTLVKLPNWGGSSTDYLTVKNSNHVEEGLTGVALDPNFKSNHWLYVHWSPLPTTAPTFRVSRFTVVGDTILMNSEKVLLSIDAQRDVPFPLETLGNTLPSKRVIRTIWTRVKFCLKFISKGRGTITAWLWTRCAGGWLGATLGLMSCLHLFVKK